METLTERDWSEFALGAELDHFGTARMVKVHNKLRADLKASDLQAESYRTALENIHRVIGPSACVETQCAGCDAEINEVVEITRNALKDKTNDTCKSEEPRREAKVICQNCGGCGHGATQCKVTGYRG